MTSQLTMYITLVCVSGVFNLFLCIYGFTRRKVFSGANIFICYTAALTIYCFFYAFALASTSLEEVKLWTTIEYIGLSTSAALGLMLVLSYLGKSVSRSMTPVLFIIPATTIIMVATNDYHHLFYKTITIQDNMPVGLVQIEIGQWYIVHGIYTFSCLLAAVILLIGRLRQTKNKYRLQLFILICGQFIPMTTAFLYLLGVTPNGLDPVPVVMCITSSLYIWAILSTKMLAVVPIAKEIIFESMSDGVIVLDRSEQLIDYNDAAATMISGLHPSMFGKTLDEIWTILTGNSFPDIQLTNDTQQDLTWEAYGKEHYYQIRRSILRHHNGEQAGSLLILIDVTELKLLQRELEQLAFYDGLTQIFNRTQFIRRSRIMLEQSLALGHAFSIIIFDIDYFKRVNDSYGHETGDRLIVQIVAVCRQLLTEDVLFARYGGEEFVLSLPVTTLEQAAALAERLRAAIEAEPLSTSKGMITVTSSFGVTQAKGDDSLEALLRQADEALYVSKRNGRNRVSVEIS